MQIWIDTEQLEDSGSVEHALEAARQYAEQHNRLIVEIHADGQHLPDELLDDPPTNHAGINELRFVTVEPTEFMLQTLGDTRSSLQATKAEQIVTAGQIQGGKLADAIASLGSVLEGWHAVRDVVDQVSALASINLGTLDVDGTSGAECINGLSHTLAEVRDALSSEDWSSLGDLLEYDLDQQASNWMSLIDSVEHTLSKG